MATYYRDIFIRYLRLAAILCLSAGAACLAGTAFGLPRAELYQATAPVGGRSDAARPPADEDPVFSPLFNSARRYVQQYRSAPDGQLWVAFDGSAIERWLTQNGQALWGRERPSTLVWV